MSDRPAEPTPDESPPPDSGALRPLPGEAGLPQVTQPRRISVSLKGLLGMGSMVLLVVAAASYAVARFTADHRPPREDAQQLRDRPAAATAETRRLEMPAAPAAGALVVAATTPRVPAIQPDAGDEPIGVRRTGAAAPASSGPKEVPPEDAPVMLVTRSGSPVSAGSVLPTLDPHADPNDPVAATTRNLQNYQRQLQGVMDTLTRSAESAVGASPSAGLLGGAQGVASSSAVPSLGGGLFGGTLQGSATPRVAASSIGNRSLTLPKGTAFTCALKTRVISATSGLVGCQVQRNVYGDDGRVLLIERGSHLDGEYRIASVRPGMTRIPVLWTRIRTPNGVTVDIDSPSTGQLGESGIDGHVDNRWVERIGAAMLLSLIDDSVKLIVSNETSRSDSAGAGTVVLPSTTANTNRLAEKVLDSTINIPPLVYRNQGGIVGIYVARDVDFSPVYDLRPVAGVR